MEENELKRFKECTFKPEINSNSLKLAEAQSEFIINRDKSVSERLYNNDYDKDKTLSNLYSNLVSNTMSPDNHLLTVQNDSNMRDLRKNLIMNESDESSIKDAPLKPADHNKSFSPTTNNTDLGIPINPKYLENITLKESKIIEELLKKRTSGK
jgi:hypothetical protein